MVLILRLLFVFLCCHANSWSATLQTIYIQEEGQKTIGSLQLTGSFIPKIYRLDKPERIVLDLRQVSSPFNARNIVNRSRLVKNVQVVSVAPQSLRLIFETQGSVNFTSYRTKQGMNLLLQSTSVEQSPPTSYPTKNKWNSQLPVHSRPNKVSTPSVAIFKSANSNKARPLAIKGTHAPQKNLRDVIVVLDPGHGGKDPGAMGPSRYPEKNVVLAIALKLKQIIDQQPGMRAVLTRHGDYYVGLRERLNIARKSNADIFISIHADAFINKNSSGASVFALSQRGATSEAARWLAEKENYSELGGVNLGDLDDRNGIIRTVLIDLSQTATISAGLQMGGRVLQNLNKITRLHNYKVEQARFVVLKSPDIPSILIETGFISNPKEEKNLTSSAYQARLTQAIFNGIKGYFWDYPPQGSRIESLSKW